MKSTRIIALLVLVISFLAACATRGVMDQIEEDRLVTNEYVTKVISASGPNAAGEIFVCLEITNIQTRQKRTVRMLVPNGSVRPSDKQDYNGTRYVKVKINAYKHKCKDTINSLPVILIENQSKVENIVNKLDKNNRQAIYVLESSTPNLGKMVANIGHISLSKDERGFEFRQFLFNHELYKKETVTKNPWMYALLPVAIIADTVVFVLASAVDVRLGIKMYELSDPPNENKLWQKYNPNEPIKR